MRSAIIRKATIIESLKMDEHAKGFIAGLEFALAAIDKEIE